MAVAPAGDWPSADLESVAACPVCRDPGRRLVHDALRDSSFGVAPGSWRMFACERCGSGYLDPRPTPTSIGRAYAAYYTHAAGPAPTAQRGAAHWVKNALANDYRRARFGLRRSPRLPGGRLLGRLAPPLVRGADLEFRYLPRARPGARLLDFGSGNGDFLRLAQAAGWKPAGVEPDPSAAEASRTNGLDVRPRLDDWKDAPGFDAVTLNHTIEHVHDPRAVLRALAAMMRPGAHLFVETPNMNAVGHRLYGPAWRGLEAPRHLLLCTPASLRALLEQTGFDHVRFRPRPSPLLPMAEMSRRMAAGLLATDEGAPPPHAPPPPPPRDRAEEAAGPAQAEFITLTAVRASAP